MALYDMQKLQKSYRIDKSNLEIEIKRVSHRCFKDTYETTTQIVLVHISQKKLSTDLDETWSNDCPI